MRVLRKRRSEMGQGRRWDDLGQIEFKERVSPRSNSNEGNVGELAGRGIVGFRSDIERDGLDESAPISLEHLVKGPQSDLVNR